MSRAIWLHQRLVRKPHRAIEVAEEHGIPVVLTLSDVSMINFLDLILKNFAPPK